MCKTYIKWVLSKRIFQETQQDNFVCLFNEPGFFKAEVASNTNKHLYVFKSLGILKVIPQSNKRN